MLETREGDHLRFYFAIFCPYVSGELLMTDTTSPDLANLVGTTILGPSPKTVHHINAQSYQQDAVVTCGGEQLLHLGLPSY
jgi:hypothetical protein